MKPSCSGRACSEPSGAFIKWLFSLDEDFSQTSSSLIQKGCADASEVQLDQSSKSAQSSASLGKMRHEWVFIFLFQDCLAVPRLLVNRASDTFEWTSLGDSYASGVGSLNYVDGRRCLRYDQAYPVLLNSERDLADGDQIFNNVACSGATYDDSEKYQFYDEDTTDQPNWQFSILILIPRHNKSQVLTMR